MTLPDASFDTSRALEGACAHNHGLPLEENCWRDARHGNPELFQAWRRGWVYAAIHADMWRAEEEAKYRCEPEYASGSRGKSHR